MVRKLWAFNADHALNPTCSQANRSLMQLQLPSAPRSQDQHRCLQGCVPSALWACFICVWFLHPIMYKKCPPVFHASGEKREAVTLEMKLKRMAQLWVVCSEHV